MQSFGHVVKQYNNLVRSGLAGVPANTLQKTGLAALLASAALAATFAACSGNQVNVNEGEVYYKVYEPERVWVHYMPVFMGKIPIMVPIYHHDDEDFIIKVRKFNERDGKLDTREFYLDRETFEQINVGDWFRYNGKNAQLHDRDVKRKAAAQEQAEYQRQH